MKTQLLIANSSTETGALIKSMLEDSGVEVTRNAPKVISYGVPQEGALGNTRPKTRRPGFGKIYNMEQMGREGVRTVPWFKGDKIPNGIKFPLLARKEHGYGGTDLVPVLQREELDWRIAAGWDWFSQFVPIEQEYRVWVFRDEVLGTYAKQMKRPEQFKYIGRNFRNGFDFVACKDQADASNEALAAVKALHLDWAAVDLIRSTDGLIYILECNTAPGAIKSGAQKTLRKLVDRMVSWLKGDIR